MTIAVLILVPFLFAVFNRLRGHINYDILQGFSSRVLFNLIMGLVIGIGFINLTDVSWYWATVFPLSFWLGETPQTGRWIGLLVTRQHLPLNDKGFFYQLIHIPANLIAREDEDFYNYALVGLAFRGLLWWGIALLPAFIINYFAGNDPSIYVILIGSIAVMSLGFPLSFHITFRSKEQKSHYIKWLAGNTCTWTELNWAYGEIVYGFICGLTLTIAYII